MTLIKRSKANWHYVCRPCDYTSERSTDKLGAEYAKLMHERTDDHVRAAFAAAMQTITDIFADAIKHTVGAIESFVGAVNTPPKNLPRDPSQRGDRRQWGGK